MAYSQEIINIEHEYARNEHFKLEDLNKLRQWVKAQPYYPETPDILIFLCLHSSYYEVAKAQNVIRMYHSLRGKWPEIFQNRNPIAEPLKLHMPVMVHWALNQFTCDNYKIIYIKIMDSDASKFAIYEQLKLFGVVSDFWLSKVGNIDGFLVVFDMRGFSWGHIPRIGFNPVRKILAYVQDALPIRLKGVHFIHSSVLVDKLLLIASPFMRKELRSIIHVHTELESVQNFFPHHCLPKDYGGNDLTIKELHDNMISTLTENAIFFSEKKM